MRKHLFGVIFFVVFMCLGCSSRPIADEVSPPTQITSDDYKPVPEVLPAPTEPIKVEPVQPTKPIQPVVLAQEKLPKLVTWTGDVQHIFFHSMLVVPELAFANHKLKSFLRDWYITKNEFNQILEQLYSKNYVIIDVYDTIEYIYKDGVKSAKTKQPQVPEGKIPIVISVDDLNYYSQTIEHGGATSLFVDSTGKLACTYKDVSGKTIVSYDSEIVLALERFIEKHPDFAMPNARGVIALTAYNGFLGYRTNFADNPTLAADTEKAQAVASTLKSMGWHFGSHSWGHLNPDSLSSEKYAAVEARWVKEATPIVGETDLFFFPFGALPFKDAKKMPALRKLGYTVFYGVERNSKTYMHGDALICNRIEIDGLSIRYKASFIKQFMDLSAITLE